MTNLTGSWQTCLRGRRLMESETVFRDWQNGGFHLEMKPFEGEGMPPGTHTQRVPGAAEVRGGTTV